MAGNNAFTQRLMLPDDANVAGNVHGGTILKMIEQAGYIAAMRYIHAEVEREDGEDSFVVSGSIDCTFLQPMHIGDVSRCEAKVVYAINSAVEVQVTVTREDLRGKRCLCCCFIIFAPARSYQFC